MSADTLISELLDLPDQVHQGDFVLNLSEGVTGPRRETLASTSSRPARRRLRRRPGLHPRGRRGANSKASYLHGSFGAGKSHFMAVLHLLLQHNPARARRRRTGEGLRQARLGRGQEVPARAVPHDRLAEHGVGDPGRLRRPRPQDPPRRPLAGRLPGRRVFKNALHQRQSAGRREVLRRAQPGGRRGVEVGQARPGRGPPPGSRPRWRPRPATTRTRLVGDLVQAHLPRLPGDRPGQGRSLRRSTRA